MQAAKGKQAGRARCRVSVLQGVKNRVEGGSAWVGGDRMRGKGLKLEEERLKLGVRREFCTVRVVRHRVPRGCGCPIPAGAQGQAGWGPGQPDPLGGVTACGRGLDLDHL